MAVFWMLIVWLAVVQWPTAQEWTNLANLMVRVVSKRVPRPARPCPLRLDHGHRLASLARRPGRSWEA